jgi:RNA polymerase sigma-54 factor
LARASGSPSGSRSGASAGLRLRQTQRLALTPTVRASLQILRLPALALAEALAREAAENPFLSVDDTGGVPGGDWTAELAAGPVGLFSALAQQIRSQPIDPETEAAALFLASELREDGYLDTSLETLAAEIRIDVTILEEGLRALQRCEPTGIGARSLAECLTLQLIEGGLRPLLASQVVSHLPDFAAGRTGRLVSSLGIPLAEVRRIAALLKTLKPRPVSPDEASPDSRIADIFVDLGPGGVPVAYVNPAAAPTLQLLDAGMAVHAAPELKVLYQRARGMTAALAARTRTLGTIGREIAARQPAFFATGGNTLMPLARADVARDLGLHPSTLSRALAGKHLAFGGALYPLAVFFQASLPASDGVLSPYDIQSRIRAMIAGESPGAPLADDDICARLRDEGVDIARRTVAKYRKCLRIPSSFQRRRQRPAEAEGVTENSRAGPLRK